MREPRALLAIESSQREQTVAVEVPGAEVVEEVVVTGDRSREDLVPAIDRAMTRAGVEPTQLDAVLLNAGPGGFTGLRVAHAAAQAIALATGAKVVQVCAAQCARAASVMAGDLGADDAGWVALASKGQEAWVRLVGAPRASEGVSMEADAWHPGPVPRLLCDEHLPPSFRDRAAAAGVTLLPLRVAARAVLAAGREALRSGEFTPPDRLVPRYPREAEAVRLWRLRHPARTDGTA